MLKIFIIVILFSLNCSCNDTQEEKLLKDAYKKNSITDYEEFIEKFPKSTYLSEVNKKVNELVFNDKNIDIENGKKLFIDNCIYCHTAENKNDYTDQANLAPPLIQAKSKLNYEWFTNWLETPEKYLKNSKMPVYHLSDLDATSIAQYIMETSDDSYALNGSIQIDKSLINQGKELYKKNNCIYCHGLDGKGTATAPYLNNIGSKINPNWAFNWIKNPRSYNHRSTMPNADLNEKELLAVVSWLDSLKWNEIKNKKLIKDKNLIVKGKELTQKYACANCHSIVGLTSNKEQVDLFTSKLKNGTNFFDLKKIIKNGVKNTAMPQWKSVLSEDQVNSISSYILKKRNPKL